MTFPITDEMVAKAIAAGPRRYRIYARGDDPGVKEAFRKALEAALDRRKGERDRRKVRDEAACEARAPAKPACRPGTRNGFSGRRRDDKSWADLPLAEPPIHVSRGMLEAAGEANDEYPLTMDTCAAIYRAMEAKRIEEQKAKPMVKHFGEVTLSGESAKRGNAPCGAELYARWHRDRWVNVTNERSGRDRRKGGK